MIARAVKLGIALLAACLAGPLLLGSVRAQGIGVAPGIVEVADAARGGDRKSVV